MKPTTLFISCEHAVDTIPREFLALFHHQKELLKTHRAIDFGAMDIATQLHQGIGAPYKSASVSRLIIDCNRSLHHSKCFSEFTGTLSEEQKKAIIHQYYQPYREDVEQSIKGLIQKGHQVLHLSCHSFTPSLNGKVRNADIGILYDPRRHGEKEVARLWHELLVQHTNLYARLNYPYRGTSDGFTTYLRKHYSEKDYIGFELEVNQALLKEKNEIQEIAKNITQSVADLLQLL